MIWRLQTYIAVLYQESISCDNKASAVLSRYVPIKVKIVLLKLLARKHVSKICEDVIR